ncbi:MAG TPA: hypothetical protein LFV91_07470 [Rickettsia endosymbiont of Bembidion nr. Transversale]|nr:hypothetical protein [Rickettsia endosymbiont of Bembidion nr. Transversale]
MEHHYLVKADDSASLVQNLYHATGLPLYFTASYSKPELANLESIDAKKALEVYGSRDDIIKKLHSIYGDSKEEVAKMLNIDPEQVSRASKLKGCVPTCRAVEGTKFSVKIDQEMLDSITSVIDVSDNKSIQARDVLDINNMCKELNELFLRFKIPPEISQDDSSSKPSTSSAKDNNEFTNQDSNYGNFQKLKDYIKEEMLKDKGKLDKLLQTVDKREQSTSSGNHYTEQELISIYQKQIEVLQEEFKNTQEYYQKNPSQYKYEPGEKLPGSAAFNRGEAKLSQWLSEEFSKIKGIAINIPSSQRNTSQKIKGKIVQDWNKTIDSLREKMEFNDKVNESINKIDQTVAIITHDMELLLQGEESIIAQGVFF